MKKALKSILCGLPAFIMLWSAAAADTWAEPGWLWPETPTSRPTAAPRPTATQESGQLLYDISMILGFEKLAPTPSQQTIYKILYNAIMRHEDSIEVSVDKNELPGIYNLLRAAPELFFFESYTAWSYDSEDVYYKLDLHYTGTAAEDERKLEELLRVARELVDGASGSDYDKELFIHDRICDRVTYDKEAVERIDSGTGGGGQSAHDALVKGTAVCNGYAEAMVLALRLAGIPSRTVSGIGVASDGEGPHAWVGLKLGSVYCLTDPTWDDSGDDLTHFYFNLSEEQMSRDHVTEEGGLAGTSDAMEYYRVNGWLAPTRNEKIADYVAERFRTCGSGRQTVGIRFQTEASYRYFVDHMDDVMDGVWDLGVSDLSWSSNDMQWFANFYFMK